jgi:hypothetical protein
VTFARPEQQRFGRALLFQARKVATIDLGRDARSSSAFFRRTTGRGRRLYFSLLSIVDRIVFPLIPIVLASAAFLPPAQGFAL